MLTNFRRDNLDEEEEQNNTAFEEFVEQKYGGLEEKERQRIESLQKFQIELLHHASTFNPQRISYSTCSIYVQENENVVDQFLTTHPNYSLVEIIK